VVFVLPNRFLITSGTSVSKTDTKINAINNAKGTEKFPLSAIKNILLLSYGQKSVPIKLSYNISKSEYTPSLNL
jgi:uncharacterized membrane protein YjjP (DUF1212 family)